MGEPNPKRTKHDNDSNGTNHDLDEYGDEDEDEQLTRLQRTIVESSPPLPSQPRSPPAGGLSNEGSEGSQASYSSIKSVEVSDMFEKLPQERVRRLVRTWEQGVTPENVKMADIFTEMGDELIDEWESARDGGDDKISFSDLKDLVERSGASSRCIVFSEEYFNTTQRAYTAGKTFQRVVKALAMSCHDKISDICLLSTARLSTVDEFKSYHFAHQEGQVKGCKGGPSQMARLPIRTQIEELLKCEVICNLCHPIEFPAGKGKPK